MTKFDAPRYDASRNTLTISVSFAKKASNPKSKEYRYLCEMRRENPGLKVQQRTRDTSTRLTYKEMETRLRRIDKNGNLIKAFALVVEIAKYEKSPYNHVYNWYKDQMKAAKAEKENEKKVSASNKEDMLKKLAEMTTGISYNASADVEEVEEYEEEEAV